MNSLLAKLKQIPVLLPALEHIKSNKPSKNQTQLNKKTHLKTNQIGNVGFIYTREGKTFLVRLKNFVQLFQKYKQQKQQKNKDTNSIVFELGITHNKKFAESLLSTLKTNFEELNRIIAGFKKNSNKITGVKEVSWLIFYKQRLVGFVEQEQNQRRKEHIYQTYFYPERVKETNYRYTKVFSLLGNICFIAAKQQDTLELYRTQEEYLLKAITANKKLANLTELIKTVFKSFGTKRIKTLKSDVLGVLSKIKSLLLEGKIKIPFIKKFKNLELFVFQTADKTKSIESCTCLQEQEKTKAKKQIQINLDKLGIAIENLSGNYSFRYIVNLVTDSKTKVVKTAFKHPNLAEFFTFAYNCQRVFALT